jgi:hypothetical protein
MLIKIINNHINYIILMKYLLTCLVICISSLNAFSQGSVTEQLYQVFTGDCNASLYVKFGSTFKQVDKLAKSRGLTLKSKKTTTVDTVVAGPVVHQTGIWENADESITLMVIFDENKLSWFVTLAMQTGSEEEAKKIVNLGISMIESHYTHSIINGMYAKNCLTHVLMCNTSNADEHLLIVLAKRSIENNKR